ncbi:MAG: alpha/beta hydrolase [bacterium]
MSFHAFGVTNGNDAALPDVRDAMYGTSPRQRLDVWKVKTPAPAPVCIFFHGGGFCGGDKSQVGANLREACLNNGIAVVSVEYRLASGKDGVPLPAALLDGALAVQYVRSRATDWGLNIDKFALYGESAGADIALWVGMHSDFADSKSTNPILRFSTRVSCIIGNGAQATLDPRVFHTTSGLSADEYRKFITPFIPVFGASSIEDMETPRVRKVIEDASVVNLVTPDVPPVYLSYGPNTPLPLPQNAPAGNLLHHPFTGLLLKEKMDACGTHCEIYIRNDPKHAEQPTGQLTFLQRYFAGK